MGNLDAIRKALSAKTPGKKSGGGDVNWYRFPSGTEEVKIRLLPAWKGSDFPVKVAMTHYELPADEEGKGGKAKCLRLYDMDCPVCEVIEEYEDRVEGGMRQAATVTGWANVLVRKDPTQKINAMEPHVAAISGGLLKWLSDLEESEGSINDQLADPMDGRDIVVKRKKKNGGFDIRTAFSSSAITDDEEQLDAIKSKIKNLDELFRAPNDDGVLEVKEAAERLREHLENVVLAGPSKVGKGKKSDDEEEEEEDQPRFKKEDKKLNKKQQDEEEEEESEEEEEGQDEEEESAPKKKSKPQDDEDEEEESDDSEDEELDEEEEEEESAPKTKLKPTAKPQKEEKQGKISEAVNQSKVSKPSGAPKCFADKHTFSEDSDKCNDCPYEFQCGDAISKSGGGKEEKKPAKSDKDDKGDKKALLKKKKK